MSTEQQYVEDFLPHEKTLAADILECSYGPITAAGARRMLMLLLRAHFSSGENYGAGFDHLKCMVWSPDANSTLRVGFYPDYDDKNPDAYPAVLVGFGGVTLSRVAIGNFVKDSNDMSSTFLLKDASLMLNVLCIAKQPGDAYDLAEMSARVITALAAPLATRAGANFMEVEAWGQPAKELPSPDRYYTVAMNVRVGYNLLVSRSVESHRVRRIVSEIVATHQ